MPTMGLLPAPRKPTISTQSRKDNVYLAQIIAIITFIGLRNKDFDTVMLQKQVAKHIIILFPDYIMPCFFLFASL